ncbi:hypothetical protein FRB94_006144 [Tulasnella sp. JGI-2019a]|nr:hypothetical protein FRB94_006144 [Tulasnella sp. JGI-2019a]KAG9016545.1 hypothetical protein FRB93_010795 [Tulasnella sp. JGI-2019a]
MTSVSPEDLHTHRSFSDMDIPSSGTSSRPIDIPPSSSYRLPNQWESIDFSQSPGFAYTPSYVGSFGSQQDGSSALNNWGERESTAVLHSHNPSGDLFDDVKYQPEGYGGEQTSNHGPSSYMQMDNQAVGAFNAMGGLGNENIYSRPRSDSNGFTYDSAVDQFSPRNGEAYSAPSPASSIGFVDANTTQVGTRSRASSVSSYHDANTSPFMQGSDYNGGVNERFDQLNFDGTQDPYQRRPSFSSSPALQSIEFSITSQDQQATSPPALMIPTDSNATLRTGESQPALDSMGNVAINFVPATPVSAGGAGGAGGSFQKLLADLSSNRNRAQQHAQSSVFERGNPPGLPSISSFNTAMEASGLGDTATAPRAHPMSWGSILSASGQSQGTASASTLPQQAASRVYHHGYNVPIIPNYGAQPSSHQQQHDSPHSPPTPEMSMTMQQQQLPPFAHQTQSDSVLSTSSGGINSYTRNADLTSNSDSAFNLMALHDDMSFLSAPILASSSRSRSKSDVSSRNPPIWSLTPPGGEPGSSSPNQRDTPSQRPSSSSGSYDPYSFATGMAQHQQHQEQQRPLLGHVYETAPGPSLDQTLGMQADFPTSLKRANSDGGRSNSHRRGAKSEDLSMLRGISPGIGGASDSEFVRSVTMADGSLAPVDPRSGAAGPTRRRGSGSGHERNASLGSLRSTPYSMSGRPSPHSSPGVSPHHSPSGGAVQALPVSLQDAQQRSQSPQQQVQNIKVERALVTTPATKTASANRRRAEANFVCPVVGCGSTFTRHFNLRGTPVSGSTR